MVEKYGHKHGLGHLAGKTDDPEVRQEILELRKDPEKAALLAADFAAENKAYLERHWGGEVGSTELYFAHFLGAGGAAGFLQARDENPLMAGADLFPKAAQANRNVFYDPETGRARSLDEIYAFFDKKFSIAKSDVKSQAAAQQESVPSLSRFDRSVRNFLASPTLPSLAPELSWFIQPKGNSFSGFETSLLAPSLELLLLQKLSDA